MSYARCSGFTIPATISKAIQKAREVPLEEVLLINVLRWYKEISNSRNMRT